MKIAIVDLRTKRVQFIYESDVINVRSFGGPWGDPQQSEHVKIPTDLEDVPNDELEAYDGEEQDGTTTIQDGEEQAFDSAKKPLKGLLGQSIMIPKYIEQPIMKPVRLMRRK